MSSFYCEWVKIDQHFDVTVRVRFKGEVACDEYDLPLFGEVRLSG